MTIPKYPQNTPQQRQDEISALVVKRPPVESSVLALVRFCKQCRRRGMWKPLLILASLIIIVAAVGCTINIPNPIESLGFIGGGSCWHNGEEFKHVLGPSDEKIAVEQLLGRNFLGNKVSVCAVLRSEAEPYELAPDKSRSRGGVPCREHEGYPVSSFTSEGFRTPEGQCLGVHSLQPSQRHWQLGETQWE